MKGPLVEAKQGGKNLALLMTIFPLIWSRGEKIPQICLAYSYIKFPFIGLKRGVECVKECKNEESPSNMSLNIWGYSR